MGTIVISANATLDGVVQDPTGEEGFRHGGWFDRIADQDRAAWAKLETDEALRAAALLMGGRSYEWFASRWASRPGEWADRLRELPKYVVSGTVEDLPWVNSTILTGDAVDAVRTLKDTVAGEIVVYASFGLIEMLMAHDLVDEVRLTICPFVLGEGRRLFGDVGATKALHLVDSSTLGDDLTFLTYRPVR
jgi:dihydrofolate reductase